MGMLLRQVQVSMHVVWGGGGQCPCDIMLGPLCGSPRCRVWVKKNLIFSLLILERQEKKTKGQKKGLK